jgi:hypothetical protein
MMVYVLIFNSPTVKRLEQSCHIGRDTKNSRTITIGVNADYQDHIGFKVRYLITLGPNHPR